jgi:hypothetical protein
MSSLFATTFYNSFSSAGQYPTKSTGDGAAGIFSEIETLKITASRSQIDLFNQKTLKLKQNLNLQVKLTILVPTDPSTSEVGSQQKDEPDSFLDHIFTDKIPLIHDLLMMGEPEIQILKVEGSPDMVDLFNAQVERMVYVEELSVEVVLVNRKKVPIQQVVSKSLDDMESALDYFFTDDFSKSLPVVHKIIMGSA